MDGLPTTPIQQPNTSTQTLGGGLLLADFGSVCAVCVCVCEFRGNMREVKEN